VQSLDGQSTDVGDLETEPKRIALVQLAVVVDVTHTGDELGQ
jgi:hypothetical protein